MTGVHLPFDEADPFSRAVVRLTMEFQPGDDPSKAVALATGTGVVIRPPSHPHYLVTAWHNLSGREPLTLKPKHSQAALPNWVTIHGYHFQHRTRLRDGDNQPGGETHPLYMTYRCPPPGATHWSQEQCVTQAAQTDVAVLRLDHIGACHCTFGLPLGGVGPPVHVSDQVYVVGYPLGLVNQVSHNIPLPIWKIGNIANDPGPDFNGLPKFLIDATTLPGMSGAPVVIRRPTGFNQITHQFLGIYTGRYAVPKAGAAPGPESFGNEPPGESSALGWVTKPQVIARIIQDGPFLATKL